MIYFIHQIQIEKTIIMLIIYRSVYEGGFPWGFSIDLNYYVCDAFVWNNVLMDFGFTKFIIVFG